MKTYTTPELIHILKDGQTANPSKGMASKVTLNSYGQLIWKDNGKIVPITPLIMTSEWTIEPQYVSFEEALTAYKDGKAIRVDVDGQTYTYQTNNQSVMFYEILHGKWQIVEEDTQ